VTQPRTRLPRLCARTAAKLAAELGKPWPPVATMDRTARRRIEHRKTFQTGEKAA